MDPSPTQRWSCPQCGREFGRIGQGHFCAPAMTVDQYYAARPAYERAVFEAVREHLESLGPFHVEPVGVGILVKRGRTIIELRPKQRWVSVSFVLNRRVDHPRITRTSRGSGSWCYHAVRAHSADDIDDQVRQWLTESYFGPP
ncbi:MAG: DUF5655 domain-containing protein [Dehalococcoidia bacterium]